MEQVGAAITAVSEAAANLAANPVQEIIEGVGNLATTVSTNALVQTSNPTVETGIPDSTDVISDDYLSCACTVDSDAMNVEKTILFGTDDWSSNHTFGTCISRYEVPQVFVESNSCPAFGQSSYFRYLRCGFRFQITTNPPPGAGGSLILAYVPPGFEFRVQPKGQVITGFDPEAILTLPHVIIDIRSSTHSALTIPYVNYKNYFNYAYRQDYRGTVVVFVLGQYTVGTGTSSTVGVSVFGEMLEADFQCPRPYQSQGQNRRRIRRRKAPPPPPNPPVGKHVNIGPAPGAVVAANSVLNITTADSLAIGNEGTAVDCTTAGASSAIPDVKEIASDWQILHQESRSWAALTAGNRVWSGNFAPYEVGNIGALMDKFMYWRGSFEAQLVVYGSSLTSGRVQLSFYPGMANSNSRTLQEMRNAFYSTGDISATPTRLTIPFTNDSWRRRCDQQYGSFYIHIVNRVCVNASSSPTMSFVLFVRPGPDFQLFCPRYGDYHIQGPIVEKTTEESEEGETYSGQPHVFLNFDCVEVPIQGSSHTLVRNLFGRLWLQEHTVSPSSGTHVVNLEVPNESHGAILQCFAYFSGELILSVRNAGNTTVIAAHSYTPEEQHDPTNEFSIMSLGAVVIPPLEIKTIRVPFYSPSPLRMIRRHNTFEPTFGYLYLCSPSTTNVTIYMGLANPNLFFKLPCPPFTTNARTVASRSGTRFFREDDDHYNILLGGDIEENPGPVVVCGPSKGGKTRLLCAMAGHPIVPNFPGPHVANMLGEEFTEIPEDMKLPLNKKILVVLGEDNDANANYIQWLSEEYPSWNHRAVVFCWPGCQLQGNNFRICRNPIAVSALLAQSLPYNTRGTQLVYQDRGLYRHYGVLFDNKVFHLDSQDILKSGLKGSAVVSVDDPLEWVPCSATDLAGSLDLANSGTIEIDFNINSNCETWAKGVIGDLSPTQSDRLKKVLVVAAAAGFLYCLPHDQSGFMDGVTKCLINLFSKQVKSVMVRMAIKFVCRLVCYLILYCHSPNILNTGVLTTLLLMDVFELEVDEGLDKLAHALIEGDFKGLGKFLKKRTGRDCDDFEPGDDHRPIFRAEGPDDLPKTFNSWSLMAKNVEWWITKFADFCKWLKEKVFPENHEDQIEQVEKLKDTLALTICQADKHLVAMRTDRDYATSYEANIYHQNLMVKLVDLNAKDWGPDFRELSIKLGQVLQRMQAVNFESSNMNGLRAEPVGIWISGGPGCGKSFLAQILIKHLRVAHGFSTYNHPTGSEHMDGYTGQEVHYIDDMGQIREEEDMKLLCQLISSQPFIVPKAELLSKGTQYRAKIVIATTNRTSFDTMVLSDTGALQRRFPIRLKIRAHSFYTKTDGTLDVALAMERKAFEDGSCWEINVGNDSRPCWQTLNWEVLTDEIDRMVATRSSIASLFNQGARCDLESDEVELIPETGPGSVNPKTMDKVKNWLNSLLTDALSWWERNKQWLLLVSALSTLASLAIGAIPAYRAIQNQLYHGEPSAKPKDRVKRDFKPEGPNFHSLKDRMVEIGTSHSTGLLLCDKKVLTFGHNTDCGFITHKDQTFKVTSETYISVSGCDQDLKILEVETPYQFKNCSHKIYSGNYKGDGNLVFLRNNQLIIKDVFRIREKQGIGTIDGTYTHSAYAYSARTGSGSCGGILVGYVSGNPIILGMHVAGNGDTGIAARLYPCFAQGVTMHKWKQEQMFDTNYHQPRRSKFSPSCFFDTGAQEPAILSNRDPRNPGIEDITKHNADKLTGNVFDPPEDAFALAKSRLIGSMSVHIEPEGQATFEEAVSSELLPIDWATSPGDKYRGKTKAELVDDKKFRSDVYNLVKRFNGDPDRDPVDVYFTCYLKDELRPKEKARACKTRVISAANWDYTIATRMVAGPILRQLYAWGREFGFGPGLNPYSHFDDLYDKILPYVICLDFKGFDGSLSSDLMFEAAQVIACFSTKPEAIMASAELTIGSTERVSDEVWYNYGGMPSGSPWTTTLNTICNLLMCYTYLLDMGHCWSETFVVAYGDDVVISANIKHNLEGIENWFKTKFGATVTSSDKQSKITWTTKNNMEFLKRRPKELEFLPKIVGALDLDNMLQHLEWTKGHIQDQLNSFYLELALHGREKYEEIRAKLAPRAPQLVHPTYACAKATITPMVAIL